MRKVTQLLMILTLIFLFSTPSSAAYFDFSKVEVTIHDDVAAEEAAKELLSREGPVGFRPFANVPTYPFGGQQNVTEATWPASMRKGMALAMPQEVKDWFKTPAFDYSPNKHTISEDLPGNVGYVTSQQEILDWFAALPQTRMKYELITGFPYYTGNGFSDYALARTFELVFSVFSIPSVFTAEEVKALGKPVVWLHGSIHGGETAPGEALLQLAKEFANGEHDDILDKVTVVIVPRFNVDGAWNNQRTTTAAAPYGHAGQSSAGVDMNRDFVAFETPIVRAIRHLQIAYDPIVSYCGHQQGYTFDSEYAKAADGTMVSTGYRRGYDAILNTSMTYNLNVNRRVRDLGFYLYEPATKAALEAQGLEWGRYVGGSITAGMGHGTFPQGIVPLDEVVSSDGLTGPLSGEIRFTAGQTDFSLVPEEGIGINGTALGNQSIVFVYEVASVSVRLDYLRRVYSQYIGALEICRTAANNLYSGTYPIMQAINAARATEIARTEPLSFWGRAPLPQPVKKNVLEYKGWKKEDTPLVINAIAPGTRDINWIYAHFAERGEQVTRPIAYIIPKDHYEAAIRLFYSGVKLERLSGDQSIQVEAYTVKSTGSNNLSPSGSTSQVTQAIRSVEKTTKTIAFPKDSFVVRMDQLGASLAGLAIEPMAIRNYGNMYLSRSPSTTVPAWYRDTFLPVSTDQEYPCYRYVTSASNPITTYPANMNLPFMLTMVEKVHAFTQEEIADIKAELGLTTDPEYVSKFQLPELSSDASYKNMANVDINESFMLPGGTIVNIKPENVLAGNIVKIVAPNGLNGNVVFMGNKSGDYYQLDLNPVTKVTVAPKTLTINEGETGTISVTLEPDDADNKIVNWSSSNETVATVVNGVVTGLSAGNATITASSDSNPDIADSCTITVAIIPVSSVTVTPKTASILVNGTVSLSVDVLPANAADKDVTWSSSNNAAATVNASGVVTGVSAGTARITASSDSNPNIADTCVVTVTTPPPPVITIITQPQDADFKDDSISGSLSVTATVDPAGETLTYQWYYNTTNSTTNGQVIGGATQASYTINPALTVGTHYYYCVVGVLGSTTSVTSGVAKVTVTPSKINVTGVTVEPKSAKVEIGETKALTANVAPTDATNPGVEWSSDNDEVATVNTNGVVTALNAGTATITAMTTEGGFMDTCVITVPATTPVSPEFPSDKDDVATRTGIPADDLEERDGKVYLKKEAAEKLAKELLGAKNVNTFILPIFEGTIAPGGVAEISFTITGKDLLVKFTDDINLIGLTFGGGAELFDFVNDAAEYGNGKFTLLLGGVIYEGEIDPDEIYELLVFIKDGGIFDLDGVEDGKVISSIFLASEKKGGGGGGGCNAYGYLALVLLGFAPFVLKSREKSRD
ncbi:MAG: Ig-like domain-containing protein [Synergistaceae bacterium]|nr:Ig-like domain-containing protein [Synergistaceae bacterium]